MPTIHRLPPSLANQIAAGEVIERPASIVKELVENSLDAQATRIRIEVHEGGRSIRITDDGVGISPDDAPLAFERFATSKLSSFEDLYRLDTMGFRGEALASVAAVARVECTTRQRGAEGGTRVRIDEEGMNIQPCGCPEGTTISIQDLFYNTPARSKFLKSNSTEQAHIQDAVLALALSNPQVGFSLSIQDRECLNTIGASDLVETAQLLLDEGARLIPVQAQGEGITVEGIASPPDLFRSDRQKQWLFLNGRWVRHAGIQKAVETCYQGQIPPSRFPIWVLSIRIDPSRLDVNVHPNKREVRMDPPAQFFFLLKEAVMGAIYPQTQAFESTLSPPPSFSSASSPSPLSREVAEEPAKPLREGFEKPSFALRPQPILQSMFPIAAPQPIRPEAPSFPWDELRLIGQLAKTYILLEHPDGLYCIDQHNSHERALFEDLAPAKLERQELLLPISLEVDPVRAARLEEDQDLFFDLGFAIERMGERHFRAVCAPAILPHGEILETIEGLLGEEDRRMNKEERWRATIACKAAIKAGESLTHEQMKQLIERLKTCPQPFTCPHGRPTGFLVSLTELNRRCLR